MVMTPEELYCAGYEAGLEHGAGRVCELIEGYIEARNEGELRSLLAYLRAQGIEPRPLQ